MTVISSGLPVSSSIVTGGSPLTVLGGGISVDAFILPGGSELVSSGGIDSGGTLDSGGQQFVSSGGSAVAVMLESAALVYVSGGATYISTQIDAPGTLVVAGGSVLATGIGSGGQQDLIAGMASGARISAGGFEQVGYDGSGGLDSMAVILAGGSQAVMGTGTAVSTTVWSGGTQTLESGGQTLATLIQGGGLQFVSSGGSATGTSVGSAGAVVVEAFGATSAPTVQNGGIEIVLSGGFDIGTTVDNGGTLLVLPGASVANPSINPGGSLVSTGVVMVTPASVSAWNKSAIGLSIGSGASLYVLAGGYAQSGTILAGGAETIEVGGKDEGSLLSGFAIGVVSGSASGDEVSADAQLSVASGGATTSVAIMSDGAEDVANGGTADRTMVSMGGYLNIEAGGFAEAPVIGSSGLLLFNAGATVTSEIVFSGEEATLDIHGTSMPTVPIGGFVASDTIDLMDIGSASGASASLNSATDMLTVTAGGATAMLQLSGKYAGSNFQVAGDSGSGSVIYELPCYVAGTLIATVRGEVAVEALAAGDRVVTREGRLAPVRWVGRRDVDCRRHARPDEVLPVRIAAHAFAPGRPRRDLWLSPDHAVFVDGALIPIRYLVNGATITVQPVARVSYLHVELDRHDVILAEGLPAESYLDTGNRAAFANDAGATQLHPDFARQIWQNEGCAVLVLAGPRLAAARRGLLGRARELGFRITRDPELALFADGRRLAAEVEGSRWRVPLPRPATSLLIRSRSWVPAHMEAADADDCRVLGVALASLMLNGRTVALDSPALAEGWHTPEADGRWTDGAAAIPVTGVAEIAFTLAMPGRYWAHRRAAHPLSPTNLAAQRDTPGKVVTFEDRRAFTRTG